MGRNEVIIDDVNVAECAYYAGFYKGNEYTNCYCERLVSPNCQTNDNCYFKQLQRAKAELEQYKKSKQASYEDMQEQWNIAVNELRDLKATDKIEFKQFYKAENDKLKAENEKLKARNKLYKKIIKENIEKANNNFMILTACIQGNLSIDDVKEYAKLSAKNDELKEEVADLEDLAECKEKRIRELSSDINVKIGQITAMEMFNKQANEYNLKYKQALKKIEEIAYTTDFDIVDIQEIVDEVLK